MGKAKYRQSFILWAALVILIASQVAPAQNLGKIDFPNSGPEAAQKHFIDGVLFLHNFEFEDAAEQFQEAQKAAPDFAMAYWGEAMTYNHPLWRQVDLEKARETLEKLGATAEQRLAKAPTQREKDFLGTLEALYFSDGDKSARDRAYSEALAAMYEKYTDDHEVATFYALSILGLTNGTRDFRNYMKAASIVEEVFAQNPLHPGAAHYMIHSYDDPIHAPLGLRAARVYAQIAPSASHAQHMISHIYVALGRWDEAAEANEKAWAVSKDRQARKQLGVEQLDFHSFFWLHYSYLQQGRYQKASEMLRTIEDAVGESDSDRVGNYAGRFRTQQLVEAPDWKAALPPSKGTFSDLFADALAAVRAGQFQTAEKLLAKMSPEGAAAEIMKSEIEALVKKGKGDLEGAIALMREAAAREEQLPLDFGPPMPSKPSHELLGEMLLEAGRAAEARVEFERALERAPRRALSLVGLARAARESGHGETAEMALKTLGEIWRHAEPGATESVLTPSSEGR